MLLTERPRGRTDVAKRDLGAEAMLYDPISDKVVRLNRTARRIWEMCDGEHDLAAIADALGAEFAAGADADVDGDVRTVVGALAGAGLLTRSNQV